MAEESQDEDDYGGKKRLNNKEIDKYDEKTIAKKNIYNLDVAEKRARKLDEIEQQKQLEREKRRHDGEEVEDSDEDIYDAEEEDDDEVKRKYLPGNDDPKMWQVRVKRNFERQAVIALLNKSIDFQ